MKQGRKGEGAFGEHCSKTFFFVWRLDANPGVLKDCVIQDGAFDAQ